MRPSLGLAGRTRRLAFPAIALAALCARAWAQGPGPAVPVLALRDAPVSALRYLRVRVAAAPEEPVPSWPVLPPGRFSPLPAAAPGGLGAALAGEPFSGEEAWVAVPLRNDGDERSWAVAGQGSGFRPRALVVASEDGSRLAYDGQELEAIRIPSRFTDVAAYRVTLPPRNAAVLYLRLEGGAPLGPGLSLRPLTRFVGTALRLGGVVDALLGFSLAACLVFSILSLGSARPAARGTGRLPASLEGLAFPALAGLALVAGRNGGAQSALLAGDGRLRYWLSLGLALAAAGLEARRAVASRNPGERRNALAWRALAVGASGLAALSPLSPALSFVLPAHICLLMVGAAVSEALRVAAASRRSVAEAAREASRLTIEADGARDLALVTAASLRAPLAGLAGMLEDLDAVVADNPALTMAARSDLALARAEAARLDLLVANIIEYSGLGPSDLSIEELDLAAVARSAAALARVALAGRGVRLEVDPPVLELRSDPALIHRLLYTALCRAARAEGAGSVRTEARSDESLVALSVVDDGMPPGSGTAALELAVISRIADRLGGHASYRRDGNRGYCDIVLPRALEGMARGARDDGEAGVRGPARPPEDYPDPLADGTGTGQASRIAASPGEARAAGRVLLAGNEPVALLAIRRRLEAAGWAVDMTVSAVEALERALGPAAYDAVIIDSSMPDLSGFAFCESLRAAKGGESLPVILLTEAGRPDEIEAAFKAGASDYVSRPASGAELAARVGTHARLAASARRELSQAARMAEFDKYRTLATLSAGVAHEIHTPNNAVLRNVPVLREVWEALEPALGRINREEGGFSVRGFDYDDLRREIPEMLNDLYLGAQDIKRIVEGLKDYARTPSGASAASPIAVNETMRYAARLLRHSIAVGTERFVLELDEALPSVRVDRLKLTQVIVNLMENAIQALPEARGSVVARSRGDTGPGGRREVVVEIIDDGVGMPPEILGSVFDPFFTTKRERGGTGLGLAVSSGIVQEAGGSIQLRSEPGRGTTAVVRLPAAEPERGDGEAVHGG